MILYTCKDNTWFATAKIPQEMVGMGKTPQEAKRALLRHLKNYMLPYLEQIKYAQKVVDEIEDFVHE